MKNLKVLIPSVILVTWSTLAIFDITEKWTTLIACIAAASLLIQAAQKWIFPPKNKRK